MTRIQPLFATHANPSLDTQRGAETMLVCSTWPRLLIRLSPWQVDNPLPPLRSSRASLLLPNQRSMFFVAGKVQLSWITRCHNTCTKKLLLPYFSLPPSPNFVRSQHIQSVLHALGCTPVLWLVCGRYLGWAVTYRTGMFHLSLHLDSGGILLTTIYISLLALCKVVKVFHSNNQESMYLHTIHFGYLSALSLGLPA